MRVHIAGPGLDETMQIPGGDTTGLLPISMVIGEIDDLGNPQVDFGFRFYNSGAFGADYSFLSLDISGVSTSNLQQQLNSLIVTSPVSMAAIPSQEPDATLRTFSEAPPTSALTPQTVRLFLGGFLRGEWIVNFDTPIHSFNLDGRWAIRP
ncbi:hypothetical protein [Kitasatospora sp. NPDC059327]|uniref:hypothetical protein n=1 Tax=Kitasatospora sp. NPDC059327 TaxID=3346803 RepID=UPI0036CC5105